MKKKWPVRFLALSLVCLMTVHMTVCVSATSTGQQIQQTENKKEQTENKLDRTNEDLQELNNDRASMQTYLRNLSAELDRANSKLAEIEEIRRGKEEAIKVAQEQIAEAKLLQEKRYEEMQQRIKFMYEAGSQSYLELFLTASSFADFLNKADYIEMINQYDRNMLDQYTRTQEEIAKKEKELLEEKETLLVLEQEATQSSSQIHETVKKTGENLKKYMAEIAEKEAQALAYEREIAEAESDLALLRAKYKEELALSAQSQAMGSRDLSDIVFASGDEDLMAAIIECEAGGESYTGKVAVGAVVMNRVRSPLFPNTVLEVIMQKKQFSPVGSGRFAIVLGRGANESCYQAARDAMAGASPVGECLFFRTPIPGLEGQQIGGHIFY
ncbi:MAG: cell wall hydrolase [Lachnospiraceae bacterium]|nr:cell wall hydrolase [Lachnospiraceae bacterium]